LHCLAYSSTRFSALARDMFGSVGGLRRRPLLPSTLATFVPTASDFYNLPYFVKLPDTATTPSTREIDIPPPTAGLLPGTWRCSSPKRFASRRTPAGARARQSRDRRPVPALYQPRAPIRLHDGRYGGDVVCAVAIFGRLVTPKTDRFARGEPFLACGCKGTSASTKLPGWLQCWLIVHQRSLFKLISLGRRSRLKQYIPELDIKTKSRRRT
jgi:hypothetical protein